MAGVFELFTDLHSHIRFRLLASDGTELAVSQAYPDKRAAAAAITDVRECAGTGLIQDHCTATTQNAAGLRRPHRQNKFRNLPPHVVTTAAAKPRPSVDARLQDLILDNHNDVGSSSPDWSPSLQQGSPMPARECPAESPLHGGKDPQN